MQDTCKKWQNFAGRIPFLTPSSAFILAWGRQWKISRQFTTSIVKVFRYPSQPGIRVEGEGRRRNARDLNFINNTEWKNRHTSAVHISTTGSSPILISFQCSLSCWLACKKYRPSVQRRASSIVISARPAPASKVWNSLKKQIYAMEYLESYQDTTTFHFWTKSLVSRRSHNNWHNSLNIWRWGKSTIEIGCIKINKVNFWYSCRYNKKNVRDCILQFVLLYHNCITCKTKKSDQWSIKTSHTTVTTAKEAKMM